MSALNLLQEILQFIISFISAYWFIIVLIWIVKLLFWCFWYGNTRKIRDYLENIEENICKTYKKNIEQNEKIIANQEKIITLLESKQHSNKDTFDC